MWRDDRWLQVGEDPRLRRDAARILRAAVRAVDARETVHRFLGLEGEGLRVGDRTYSLGAYDRVLVIGFGKACTAMAQAVEEVLGDRISGGLVVTKEGHGLPLGRLEVVEAGHPLPDARGEEAARRVLRLAQQATERDLLLCLISGGGSALLPLPAPGLTLEDKVRTTDLLLRNGATIGELNTVRKHLSAIKGGWLARAAYPATVVALVLSDVLGDRLDVIASGPLVPDSTTYRDALEILERYGLLEEVPEAVRRHLERGLAGEIPETPKPGDPAFERVHAVIVGNIARAAEAASSQAQVLGYHTLLLTTCMEGEAREIGRVVATLAIEERRAARPLPLPACLVLGGETTVTVRGRGKGGRNQELALSAAVVLEGVPGVLVVSFATDGTDGPTDAAGGATDGTTAARARALGYDPRRSLADNDAYPCLDAVGDLVRTGPTGTNVNDLVLVLVGDQGRRRT
ncbi:MAG: glycerate kinase [Armatimonadota bacterium]|nr:glycerate kinase [Armatimonadota bacterium]MDR7562142.1 glycerate kinase [Armatimonadota bacterium]MDR7567616.1 glycerate kinase [Armatimonadota bacterium]MDR7602458.1 glycerate kinase [Armatimonadota bacterium]